MVALVSGSNPSAVTMHAVMFRPLTAMLDELAQRLSEAAEELSTARVVVAEIITERQAALEVIKLLLEGCLPAIARDGTRIWVSHGNFGEPVALVADAQHAVMEAAQQV
jgi:L-lactate utilization protein LutC